ncbi:hypothetical protein [Niabella soli]|uniref:Uncharacterized protein n=1 Tax=Niabella soli DSM 19437 TaxID=929713 RepID=W0F4F6_9BACT|nr:hypothetical protein [Niabella soli]AHF17897.1 hypothetical protein NIASO_16190 [Niabella soli DSM 19437]
MALLAATIAGKANDTLTSYRLLKRIAALQVKENDIFPAGAFPSYRMYALNKTRWKADINPFFTGLVALTLRTIQSRLTPYQQQMATAIIEKTRPVFNKFLNRTGRISYNFWPTDTVKVFPNGGWLNWMDQTESIPDDLDDTSIILLALDAPPALAKQAHDSMQQYINTRSGKIKNTLKRYRHLPAYSTWYGKKMPIDFDVSVLANVLYMVQRYHLNWTIADSASLRLLENSIKSKAIISRPAYISPHYKRTPVILYHLARLMALKPIPELELYKPLLVKTAKKLLRRSKNTQDQVILSTALLRWGELAANLLNGQCFTIDPIESDLFSFFIANMTSIAPNPFKSILGATKIGVFYYYCPAYDNLLLLEYAALTQAQ